MLGRRLGVSLTLFLLLVAGCAGFQPLDRPQDLPFHAGNHPMFDLHWRLQQGEGRVSAVGVVEASRVSGIDYVIVELRWLDREGRVVSQARGRTFQGRLYRGDTQPFVVRLRPTGKEERFDLTVWDFGWAKGVGA